MRHLIISVILFIATESLSQYPSRQHHIRGNSPPESNNCQEGNTRQRVLGWLGGLLGKGTTSTTTTSTTSSTTTSTTSTSTTTTSPSPTTTTPTTTSTTTSTTTKTTTTPPTGNSLECERHCFRQDGQLCLADNPDSCQDNIYNCPTWSIVVNNNNIIPDTDERPVKKFGSYNAPSVNSAGIVVFRARSVGGGDGGETERRLSSEEEGGGPSTGVFVRDMSAGALASTSIIRQAGRRSKVPQPNNLDVAFFEFPSFPRISKTRGYIATRGNHQGPVWEYKTGTARRQLEEEADTTRVGNTAVYANLKPLLADTSNDATGLFTAFSKLGAVGYDSTHNVNFSDLFEVPGLEVTSTVFDVFPGSPGVDDYGNIGTKGNYQKDGTPKTGVFYRNVAQVQGPSIEKLDKGLGCLHVIANSESTIPSPISGSWTCTSEKFGSTAPPSLSDGKMVFLGLDNESDPKCGGIYLAMMHGTDFPCLAPIVDLATKVPGQDAKFSWLGEIISFDGHAASFWGAWGDDKKNITLCCPSSGNKERRDFCNNAGVYFPDKGDKNTIIGDGSEGCPILGEDITFGSRYQVKSVPVNQGFFVYDGENIKAIHTIEANESNDLTYWVYSGKPPAAGGGLFERRLDGDTDAAEEPRWRSGSFSALSSYNDVMFKQTANGVVGVWHWDGEDITPVVLAGESCSDLDGSAEAADMVIDNISIERDGYRSSRLAVAAACSGESTVNEGEEDSDWGGIYVRQFCPSSPY